MLYHQINLEFLSPYGDYNERTLNYLKEKTAQLGLVLIQATKINEFNKSSNALKDIQILLG